MCCLFRLVSIFFCLFAYVHVACVVCTMSAMSRGRSPPPRASDWHIAMNRFMVISLAGGGRLPSVLSISLTTSPHHVGSGLNVWLAARSGRDEMKVRGAVRISYTYHEVFTRGTDHAVDGSLPGCFSPAVPSDID